MVHYKFGCLAAATHGSRVGDPRRSSVFMDDRRAQDGTNRG